MWKLTTEELPPLNEPVLATPPQLGPQKPFICCTAVRRDLGESGWWMWGGPEMGRPPLYWMPLPAPPAHLDYSQTASHATVYAGAEWERQAQQAMLHGDPVPPCPPGVYGYVYQEG